MLQVSGNWCDWTPTSPHGAKTGDAAGQSQSRRSVTFIMCSERVWRVSYHTHPTLIGYMYQHGL